jgi:hypothetical protein
MMRRISTQERREEKAKSTRTYLNSFFQFAFHRSDFVETRFDDVRVQKL